MFGGFDKERSVQLNLQTNAETMESVELGGTKTQKRSTLKSSNQAAISFYNFICAIWSGIGILLGIGLLIMFILYLLLLIYLISLKFLEGVGVVIPEEYWTYAEILLRSP